MEAMVVVAGLQEGTEDGKVDTVVAVETTVTTSILLMFHPTRRLSMLDQMLHQSTLGHTFQLSMLAHTFHPSTMERMLHSTTLAHMCLSFICHRQSQQSTLDQWDHQFTYRLLQQCTISRQLFTINLMLLATLRTTTTGTEFQLVEIILAMMALAIHILADRAMEVVTEMEAMVMVVDTVVDMEDMGVAMGVEMLDMEAMEEVKDMEDGEVKEAMEVATEDTQLVDTEVV